jgi:hypothetical protein
MKIESFLLSAEYCGMERDEIRNFSKLGALLYA